MGRWEERTQSWWEINVIHCDLCGQMIPREVWVTAEGLGFCGPACEKLYHSYWIPKYGAKVTTR